MRRPRGLCLAALALLVVLSGCTSAREQRIADLRSQAGGDVQVLVDQTDLIVGVAARSDATRSWPCFAADGGGQGGGSCMTLVGDGVHAGWAVELGRGSYGKDLLFVATDPRAAVVRIPRSSGKDFTVVPHHVRGLRQLVAVAVDPPKDLALSGNKAQAFDASGRLLGTTHDCEGLGGPPDCGPYDGLLDKNFPRPRRSGR